MIPMISHRRRYSNQQRALHPRKRAPARAIAMHSLLSQRRRGRLFACS
jgi:hypothetical protein